jgi:hypothetical protein
MNKFLNRGSRQERCRRRDTSAVFTIDRFVNGVRDGRSSA